MSGGDSLQVNRKGQLVGYIDDIEHETVELLQSYKIKGRWVPLHTPAAHAFLQELDECSHLQVTVDDLDRAFFSLESPWEAWLYVRDSEGSARLARGAPRGPGSGEAL